MTERATIVSRERSFEFGAGARMGVRGWKGGQLLYLLIWHAPIFWHHILIKVLADFFKEISDKGGGTSPWSPKKCHFWLTTNGTPKKWDPYAGIGLSEVKNRVFFLYFSQKLILYGKTRQRLSMKIDLYDTFRILEDRGNFWLPMVSWGTPYFGTRFWLKFWLISSKKFHPKGGVLAGGPPKNGHSWGPINKMRPLCRNRHIGG